MAQQSQSILGELSEIQKQKINQTLFFLEKAMDQVDMILDKGHKVEHFIQAFAATIGQYVQLIDSGTERPRAKGIILLGVRNGLADLAEKDNKTKSND